jgi:hypothetical protein
MNSETELVVKFCEICGQSSTIPLGSGICHLCEEDLAVKKKDLPDEFEAPRKVS